MNAQLSNQCPLNDGTELEFDLHRNRLNKNILFANIKFQANFTLVKSSWNSISCGYYLFGSCVGFFLIYHSSVIDSIPRTTLSE